VDRALAKDPDDRFPTMSAFATELRRSLTDVDTPDAARTLIVPSPVLKQSRQHRVRPPRSRAPLYALLALLAVGAIVAGVLALGGSKGKPQAAAGAGTQPIALTGVTGYDPQGSGGEHDGDAAKATDGTVPRTGRRSTTQASNSAA